ncbi:MAG: pyridine nucleotide-disulfide oxidoreductase [Maricaulis sp.]|jgi:3-phenylpropionate/trans-cinnamate dioxygenase ferredoxin reductase subunit|nr:pyridine nucleotide-disulfide oxidoreductase [Maricaulis sp.]HAQ33962.1 pyridine nucleotide-disulfide oxidoreductase [Alphaproteobacteria bacterium]
MSDAIVILGAGQAGVQLADSLRREKCTRPIVLLSDETDFPYQRPPLSKTYLLGSFAEERLPLRGPDFYDGHGIDLRLGVAAESIDRDTRTVRLSTGEDLAYGTLVLATGTRVRDLPIPGIGGPRVHALRSLADSRKIRAALEGARHVAVIGGGFIGLETASAAAKMGKQVTVVEMLDRLMRRAVGPRISSFFHELHAANGVEIRYGAEVRSIGEAGTITLGNGDLLDSDLVILGAGVVPNCELATEAGLACNNGIDTDEYGRTADPDIFAIGDCAHHLSAFARARIRLESIQNAADQARALAKTLAGTPTAYVEVPWFWSDQYDVKLQMAGLSDGADQQVERGDPASGSFSVFYFREGRVIAADSVRAPADHMAMRRILAKPDPALTAEEAADTGFDLKQRM